MMEADTMQLQCVHPKIVQGHMDGLAKRKSFVTPAWKGMIEALNINRMLGASAESTVILLCVHFKEFCKFAYSHF